MKKKFEISGTKLQKALVLGQIAVIILGLGCIIYTKINGDTWFTDFVSDWSLLVVVILMGIIELDESRNQKSKKGKKSKE